MVCELPRPYGQACFRFHLNPTRAPIHVWSYLVIILPTATEGAACTVLLATSQIELDEPLMIANCDQWIDYSIDSYLAAGDQAGVDGVIMTMTANDAKWSYVRCDERGDVREVKEKVVISDQATVGIYNFRQASLFVTAARELIANDDRVKGEFYVAPTYNYLIRGNRTVRTVNVGREQIEMHGLGTPEDLWAFETMMSNTAI